MTKNFDVTAIFQELVSGLALGEGLYSIYNRSKEVIEVVAAADVVADLSTLPKGILLDPKESTFFTVEGTKKFYVRTLNGIADAVINS